MALAIVCGRPLQLYSIHAYYYRSVLGGMCVHFNFLDRHVCILYIAYHEYSMIDPSGIIFQVLAAVSLLPLLAAWIGDGVVVAGVRF